MVWNNYDLGTVNFNPTFIIPTPSPRRVKKTWHIILQKFKTEILFLKV